jgi:hypothetical protein
MKGKEWCPNCAERGGDPEDAAVCDTCAAAPAYVEPTNAELIALSGVPRVIAFGIGDLRKAYRLGVAHGKLQRK